MRRPRIQILLAVALATALAKAPSARGAEPAGFVQENISTAKIAANDNRFVLDVSLLATDVEQMFQKTAKEREGVELAQPGVLEREIGKFIASRVTMRDASGAECTRKIEKSGEDPANDEAVLVELSFECASADARYDATQLLATQSSRAWQVVTVLRGEAKRQFMISGDSPPVRMADTHGGPAPSAHEPAAYAAR